MWESSPLFFEVTESLISPKDAGLFSPRCIKLVGSWEDDSLTLLCKVCEYTPREFGCCGLVERDAVLSRSLSPDVSDSEELLEDGDRTVTRLFL